MFRDKIIKFIKDNYIYLIILIISIFLKIYISNTTNNLIIISTNQSVKIEINDLEDIEEECFSKNEYKPSIPKYLVIHCTGNPPRYFTKKELLDFFFYERYWSKPGYNYVINPDGSIIELSPINNNGVLDYHEIVNSVKGYNSKCIAIAYSGGTDKKLRAADTRTAAQKISIENLINRFKKQFPGIKVQGHKDFPNVAKACPSFNI